jgi:hypothetical protein
MDLPLGNPRKTFDPDSSVCHFFDAAPGALKGHLSTVELVRITLTSMAAGGGILGLFQAVLRRLGHGRELAPDNASGMRGHPRSNALRRRN